MNSEEEEETLMTGEVIPFAKNWTAGTINRLLKDKGGDMQCGVKQLQDWIAVIKTMQRDLATERRKLYMWKAECLFHFKISY